MKKMGCIRFYLSFMLLSFVQTTSKNSKFLVFALIQFFVISSCWQSPKGHFRYPNSYISDLSEADSLYTLALAVQANDADYAKALLFRNEYGWQLNKVDQLKNDFPEILALKEYQGEFKYHEIFDPQHYPPEYWQQFYEIATELKKHFNKETTVYRENLGILTYTEILLNKNDKLLSDLPELLGILTPKSDNYFFMLWQFGMAQARDGDDSAAMLTFEEGFQSPENKVNKREFALAVTNLYSLHEMYDKVIEYESYITGDTISSMLFYLGEAYFRTENFTLAEKYFDAYTERFEKDEYSGMVFTSDDNSLNPVRPVDLEVLGDFYLIKDQAKSCEFYNLGIEILSEPKDDLFYEKMLEAIKDPIEEKKMQEHHEKFEQEQASLLDRLKKKAKKCL